MKKSPLIIHIDRLRNDDIEDIFEVFDAGLLDIEDSEISFIDKVTVSGRAYLAKNHLILDGKIKTLLRMPCSICNEFFDIALEIDDFTLTLEIEEIPSVVYDYLDEVRSALLLKVPKFAECTKGGCHQRKELHPYLKKDTPHSPFSDLTL